MKKAIRLIALCLVLVMGMGLLASCGKTLSGKYSADIFGTGTTLTFSGKNVKVAVTVLSQEVASVDATYEIKDDKIGNVRAIHNSSGIAVAGRDHLISVGLEERGEQVQYVFLILHQEDLVLVVIHWIRPLYREQN